MARGRRKSRVRWILLCLLFLLLLIPVAAFFLVTESTPVVFATKKLEANDVQRAKQLAKHVLQEVLSNKRSTTLTFTERELNGMAAMLSQGVPDAIGRVNITSYGLEGALTYALPRPLRGRYLNLRAGIDPSSYGLYINQLQVGSLTVSGETALSFLRAAGNLVLGNQQGSELVNSIRQVALADNQVTAVIHPPQNLSAKLKGIRDRIKSVRDEVALLGDPNTVRVYYTKLIRFDSRLNKQGLVSLADYMNAVFELARSRSIDHDPVEENRAAILALAMYLGDIRFEKFIGSVRTNEQKKLPRPGTKVVLGGRTDLRLHFIISAGLEIVADSGISHAIGEFKELLDTGSKGSGFSFVDLAADRAGVKFGSMATESGNARRIQQMLAGTASEKLFFPVIDGLQEGLSESKFQEIYGGVDGEHYREVVALIDQRIDKLQLYF